MAKLTKKQKEAKGKFDVSQAYTLNEASALVKEITNVNFDASVDLAVRLGVDPRKANQMVRGVVTLMGKLGPLGRILGPRGLMPNPKTGTVTMDVAKAVKDVKAGKIDFKVDKTGIVHASVGKASFDVEKIAENANELIQTLIKLKPTAAKGTYIKSIYMSSTMSPGINIDAKSV
jgi:large subunit ribosomal protein L1